MNSLMHVFSKTIKNKYIKPNQIIMVGLDDSGKTTILYRLKLNHNIYDVMPTSSFNVESVNIVKRNGCTIWDISGMENLRPLWKTYVRKSDGIIFVIDSSNSERFDEAKVELENILNSKDARGIPLLILANKQDKKESLTPIELSQRLNLDSLDKSVKWYIHAVSGCYGDGIYDAMLQFMSMINVNKDTIKEKNLHNKSRNIGCFHSIEASKFI